jgi:hypothetical protein
MSASRKRPRKADRDEMRQLAIAANRLRAVEALAGLPRCGTIGASATVDAGAQARRP